MVSGLLCAQTAEDLETVLTAQEISCSQAAWFVFAAAEIPPGNGNALTAFDTARQNGWIRRAADNQADSPVSLGELSLLIMKSFGLQGGILYTLFSNPRYACRELVYLKIIQGRTDPGGTVDGRTFLQILGRTLTHTGESP
jgi:hypothetical protein